MLCLAGDILGTTGREEQLDEGHSPVLRLLSWDWLWVEIYVLVARLHTPYLCGFLISRTK